MGPTSSPRGAGTGLSGGAIPLRGSVVIALTRMNRIIEIDAGNQTALVEPGVVNIELSQAAAKYGLYYAPDPSSQRACTIGGNVAENAGGPHCLAYGVTTNHVLGTEVVLPDGEITWLGSDLRESAGFDLRGAFIGSEGTLGIATKISVRLLKTPETIHTLLAAFPSIDSASQAVSDIIASGIVPAALEMMDRNTIDACEPVFSPGVPGRRTGGPDRRTGRADGKRSTTRPKRWRQSVTLAERPELRSADDPDRRAELWATRKGGYWRDGHARAELLPCRWGCSPDATQRGAGQGDGTSARKWNSRSPTCFTRETATCTRAYCSTNAIAIRCGGSSSAATAYWSCASKQEGRCPANTASGIEKQAYMPLVFSDADMEAMARLRPAFGGRRVVQSGKSVPGRRGAR